MHICPSLFPIVSAFPGCFALNLQIVQNIEKWVTDQHSTFLPKILPKETAKQMMRYLENPRDNLKNVITDAHSGLLLKMRQWCRVLGGYISRIHSACWIVIMIPSVQVLHSFSKLFQGSNPLEDIGALGRITFSALVGASHARHLESEMMLPSPDMTFANVSIWKFAFMDLKGPIHAGGSLCWCCSFPFLQCLILIACIFLSLIPWMLLPAVENLITST